MVVSVVGKLIVIHGAQKTCYFGDPSFLHFLVQTDTYFLVVDPDTAKVEDAADLRRRG
jgi:hypothetical protein